MAMPKRDEELSGKEKFDEELLKVLDRVTKGFRDQIDRAEEIHDNWDMYNCNLGEKQFYNGESKIYLPFVRDAVEAQVTRFTNQAFPASGRYVEVTSSEETLPQGVMALLEAYVRKTRLRTQVVPALLRNGAVEGQYNLYLDWSETKRSVVNRIRVKPTTLDLDNEAADEVDDIEEDEILDGKPLVEVIADADVCVLPATSDSIEEALEVGGSVTVIRRWTKGKVEQMMREGHIREDEGGSLVEAMESAQRQDNKDQEKDNAKSAGIKARGKHAFIYETWSILKIGKGKDAERRLCRTYYAGDKRILGCKQAPFWNDRCPLLSAPVNKVAGVFKGKPPVSAVADMQIFANDTINEGADTAHFSAMPIVMTDPEKNPRVGTMILGLAAVWETNPNDTKFVQFPELWMTALDRAKAIQQQIFQTLGVNPSMIPQSTGGKSKRNQAEIAMEQQVDLLTTAAAVTVLEEEILTPMIQRFAEYDEQFRENDAIVRSYGELGVKAVMETVPLVQLGGRYEFRWFGVESNRNAAQVQQQLSLLNLLNGVPPEKMPGYKINVAPVMVQIVENTLGPRLAGMVLEKETAYSVDPSLENDLLAHGFRAPVHPADDDLQHLQIHMAAMQEMGDGGDPHGTFREHVQAHLAQLQAKAQKQMLGSAGPPGGTPGPGSGQAQGGPPQQGGPPPGAQVGAPHAAKAPPGAIHPDAMPAAGGIRMPRKT